MNIQKDIIIKSATILDLPIIYKCIKGLGVYENATEEQMPVTLELLEKNLFQNKYAEILIAYINSEPVGFCAFFHNFSTWLGKPGIYIEDLFVFPEFRKNGVGLKLIKEVCKIAIERDCGRVDWSCLDWNEPALNFYKKINASSLKEWVIHRLERKDIEKLAEETN